MTQTSDTPDAATAIELLSDLDYTAGDLARYLEEISRAVSRVLGVDWSVVTLTEDGLHDRILASSLRLDDPPDKLYQLHGTVTETVIRSGKPLTVEDACANRDFGSVPKGYTAYIGVPLQLKTGHTIGTLCSFNRTSTAFSDENLRIARVFADRAASAIDNYRAYEKLAAFNLDLERAVAERTAELQRTQEALILHERLAAIGEFASMIVHEIRSPLSTIGMAMDYLADSDLDAPAAKRVALAVNEGQRLRALLDEILQYARAGSRHPEPIDLGKLAGKVLETLSLTRPDMYGRVAFDAGPVDVTVSADPDRMRQLIINLVSNACEASPADASVSVRIRLIDGMAVLTVANQVSDALPKDTPFTQPFFTTKKHGTGLGLAIVQNIVDRAGGRFVISTDANTTVTAEVRLPASDR